MSKFRLLEAACMAGVYRLEAIVTQSSMHQNFVVQTILSGGAEIDLCATLLVVP